MEPTLLCVDVSLLQLLCWLDLDHEFAGRIATAVVDHQLGHAGEILEQIMRECQCLQRSSLENLGSTITDKCFSVANRDKQRDKQTNK
jgi:hypothetical protein